MKKNRQSEFHENRADRIAANGLLLSAVFYLGLS